LRWCDLAEAYEREGEDSMARQCMERAVELGGHIPQVLIRAAAIAYGQGRKEEALQYSRRVLEVTNAFDELVFLNFRRFQASVDEVLRAGLPKDGQSHESYFRNFLNNGNPADAERIWSALGERGWQTPALAGRYCEYLVQKGLYDTAAMTWSANREGDEGAYGRREFIWNGGFEEEPVEGPFDWWWREVEGTRVARDDEIAREGSHAIRVEFDGSRNVAFRGLWQQSWLPGGRYRLRALARTEGVTTDQGVYVQARSEAGGQVTARTEAVRGTAEWTPIEAEVVVRGPGALVRIEVRREESSRIDNKISGRVWLDEVTLRRVGEE
jgi:hypothetical protein